MAEEGLGRDALVLRRTVDARYRGQSFELPVPAEHWVAAFHEAHSRRYGYARPEGVVEAVTLRVEATAAGAAVPGLRLPMATDPDPSPAGRGDVVARGRPRFSTAL